MHRLRDDESSSDPVAREMARLLRLGRAPDPPAAVERRIRAALVSGARPRRRAGSAVTLRWAVAVALVVVTGAVAGAWVIRTRAARRRLPPVTTAPPAAPSSARPSPAKTAPPAIVPPPAPTPEAIVDPWPSRPPAEFHPSRSASRSPRVSVEPTEPAEPVEPVVPAAPATQPPAPAGDDDDGPLSPRPSPQSSLARPVPVAPPLPPPAAAPAPAPAAPEAALVLEATRALHRDGDPREALRLVGRYLERYPGGALEEESLALAIEARTALGDAAAATATARDYLSRFPSGRYREVARGAIRHFEPR